MLQHGLSVYHHTSRTTTPSATEMIFEKAEIATEYWHAESRRSHATMWL